MDDDTPPSQQVKYRVQSEMFTPPDDHSKVGDDVYLAPYSPELDQFGGADLIEVLDWDVNDKAPVLSGPPELVITDEDVLKVAAPSPDGSRVTFYGLGAFRCERCGTVNRTTEVKLGDEITPPHECDNCERQGPFSVTEASRPGLKEEIQEAATGTPIWDPPGGAFEADIGAVWGEVRDHIETYWDARGREWLYEMATAYALSTWFREEFTAVPHLFVFGKTETGKTRFLNTMKEVSYRAVHTVGASPAYIYRAIDEYGITFFLSEYHDINEETQNLIDQVIKAGQKRGEVIGKTSEIQGGQYTPENFQPFTHVAVSSQYEPRADIVNRAHQVTTKPADASVPRNIESRRELRGKLLWLRYRYLDSPEMEQAKADAERYMDINGIKNRLGEKLWCLLTVAELADRDISNFIEEAVEQDAQDMAETEDAMVVRVLIDQAFENIANGQTQLGEDNNPWTGLKVGYNQVCDAYEDMTGREMTPSRLGHIVSRLNLDSDRYRDGTYVDDPDLQEKLQSLADENNIDWDSMAEANDAAEAASDDSHPGIDDEAEDDVRVIDMTEADDIRADIIEVVNNHVHLGSGGASKDSVIESVADRDWDRDRVAEKLEEMLKEGSLQRLPDDSLKVGEAGT